MSGFWNLWIAGLVTLNIGFVTWLLLATTSKKKGDQAAGPETTGHTWDGDLKEYNNPLPRWWLGIFYGSIVFAVIYLVIFPGFGSFAGVNGWSQVKQWSAAKADADAVVAREFAKFDGKSVEELSTDPAAIKVAKNLFAANCAMCHGSDAHGGKGFPNLTSPNLTYGRTAADIVTTISAGRIGVMPAWGPTLGADGVTQVANYVVSLSGHTPPDAAAAAAGKDKFATICSACHGPDGKGNKALGAPNLTDDYWIYGSSVDTIKETVNAGRTNRMPAWLETLGEQKVKLLAAYVYSLAPPPAEATPAPAPAEAPAPTPGS
jgi:cytochrome c oxidase cbb3-type subunit 3